MRCAKFNTPHQVFTCTFVRKPVKKRADASPCSAPKNWSCSHPNTLSLVVVVPEHLVQLPRVRTRTRRSENFAVCLDLRAPAVVTQTRAILCHLRPLSPASFRCHETCCGKRRKISWMIASPRCPRDRGGRPWDCHCNLVPSSNLCRNMSLFLG